ncbi:tetratricopeptide repeat protein [Streptomyces sp. NPDC005752]|uniref:tetratricopeptide repeat protein n=1 Tax=Streptomyces sp. NPDC005752 TaxID=3157065 RepID=UPI0033E9D415
MGDTRIASDYTTATGLLFEDVRDAFRASRAAVKIAVLDCCNAGLAAQDYGRLSPDRIPPVSGTYLLMSSSAFESSWYEEEDVHDAQTYFTRALVDTVREGVAGGPAGLTFDHIFPVVADQLVENGRPEPGRRIEDNAAGWVFARNNAPEAPSEPGGDPEALYRSAYRMETEEGVEQLPLITLRYQAAAAPGHAPSMNRLGQMAEGRVQARIQGIKPGPVTGEALQEATEWYTRAYETGDHAAPLHLGQLYEEQYGNQRQALSWYDLADRRGNSAAKERLTGLQQRIRLGIGASPRPEDGSVGEPDEDTGTGLTYAGQATELLRGQWLAEWGDTAPEHLALAECLDVLAEACGGTHGEWGTLPQPEQAYVLRHFTDSLPRRTELVKASRRYYESVGPGKLRAHAARLRRRAEEDPIAPPARERRHDDPEPQHGTPADPRTPPILAPAAAGSARRRGDRAPRPRPR